MIRAEQIARLVLAVENCRANNNAEWLVRHMDKLNAILSRAPTGAGFDNGIQFNFDSSSVDKLVFDTAYHHMNDAGYYDGWTEHTITVRPSFIGGFDLKVSGRNKRDIKSYIETVFHNWLNESVKENE